MSFLADTLGALTGAKKAAKGAQKAANIQSTAADRAIAEQRVAREQATTLQQPFVDAGGRALAQQMSLLGLNGTAGQQDALNALLTGPEYTTGVMQGEEAILQNAAATGGLRGGNTQNSLARFRGDLLQSVFNSQFNRLGGITSLGQNAAAGSGNAVLGTANNIGDLLGQQGAALAGGAIAKGNVAQQGLNNAIKIASAVAGFSSPKPSNVSGFWLHFDRILAGHDTTAAERGRWGRIKERVRVAVAWLASQALSKPYSARWGPTNVAARSGPVEAYSHTELAGLAADCRRRAALTDNQEAGAMLRFMAGEYEDRAVAAARAARPARVTI